jgi:NAD(P)-dependent dehydrogenase (short-subunit alcohol dehydrogenase family)
MTQLKGKVAVVTGATRGAGRGIACALGDAGATVYCTGRSMRGKLSPIGRPETIEETAEMVTARGGVGIWAQVDHTDPNQVKELFERIREEQNGCLDILVNNISGDEHREWNPLVGGDELRFWERSLEKGLLMQTTGVHSHIITSYYAAQLMVKQRQGLIVEINDGNYLAYNNCGVFYSLTKTSAILLAYFMSEELYEYDVAVVSLTPGDMLSEKRFELENITDETWAEIRKKPGLEKAESCLYTGRAVIALATDPKIMTKTGHALSTGYLAREYGFTDVDGAQPMWYVGEGKFSNGNFVVQENR